MLFRMRATAAPIASTTARFFSSENESGTIKDSFDKQVQGAVMNFGLNVGSQVVETMQAIRDLYEDEDGDEEELAAMN